MLSEGLEPPMLDPKSSVISISPRERSFVSIRKWAGRLAHLALRLKAMNPMLKKLQASWHGPGVEIILKDQTYQLGEGTPKTKLIIKNPSVLRRLPLSPSLAFGEAYMNGGIIVEGSLLDILEGFNRSRASFPPLARLASGLMGSLPISTRRAAKNAQHHYDIGNDFYKLWLDKNRVYSCAYFLHEDDDLDTAQQQKLELICRKARLAPGHTLLDIGCGWGGLMFHAVNKYGVHATGITPAKEQASFIEEKARQEGLQDKIKVIRGDWRSLSGKYDRIISVGMFEHVGKRQYAAFFKKWRELLKDNGVSFLHTIGRMSPAAGDPWITKYIFPGGYLPSLEQMAAPIAGHGMLITDVENLWHHYDLTLQRWLKNFEQHVPEITKMFDEKFVRMWRLYLLGSISTFRWGGIHLWQLVILPSKSSPWPLNREVNATSKS